MIAPHRWTLKDNQTESVVTTELHLAVVEDGDIHGFRFRYEAALNRLLADASIPDVDKEIIKQFLQFSQAQGVSYGRLFKLTWSLHSLRAHLPCNIRDATKRDITQLLAWLNTAQKTQRGGAVPYARDSSASNGRYSANTKSDMKKILKKFYKFVKYGDADKLTPYPEEVRWISTGIKKNEVVEPDPITEAEAKRMIEAAPSTIDKAFIAFLFEGGFRIGEALNTKISSVQFDANGALVRVTIGKTGFRIVRLITCVPLLTQYIQQHPMKNEPNAPLWYYFPSMNTCKRMDYRTARIIIKRAAQLAGIQRRIWIHLYRHSAATRDSTYGLNERMLEIKYGWSKGSKQAARYSHLDGQVVDEALMRVYAGQEPKKAVPEFKLGICPRCKENNTPGIKFCGRCGMSLEPEDLLKAIVPLETVQMRDLQDNLATISKQMSELTSKRRQEQDASLRELDMMASSPRMVAMFREMFKAMQEEEAKKQVEIIAQEEGEHQAEKMEEVRRYQSMPKKPVASTS